MGWKFMKEKKKVRKLENTHSSKKTRTSLRKKRTRSREHALDEESVHDQRTCSRKQAFVHEKKKLLKKIHSRPRRRSRKKLIYQFYFQQLLIISGIYILAIPPPLGGELFVQFKNRDEFEGGLHKKKGKEEKRRKRKE